MDEIKGNTQQMITIVSQDGTTVVNWDDVKCIKGVRLKTGGKQYYDVQVYFRSGEKTSIAKYERIEECVKALDGMREAMKYFKFEEDKKEAE